MLQIQRDTNLIPVLDILPVLLNGFYTIIQRSTTATNANNTPAPSQNTTQSNNQPADQETDNTNDNNNNTTPSTSETTQNKRKLEESSSPNSLILLQFGIFLEFFEMIKSYVIEEQQEQDVAVAAFRILNSMLNLLHKYNIYRYVGRSFIDWSI